MGSYCRTRRAFLARSQIADALAGRKRPLHTIIPGFMQHGDEHIGFASWGDGISRLAHAQFVSNVVDIT